ncbi:hypothetical protein NDU88_007803 [Pleurodeles waltl]|uniref:Uncharacterized protein n=1 Tax=Pleurodeles waltl TaxID=8319 RepID=A0AAV7M3Z5_PLEWA|nr:hypothetical protein NDU88_007803 [Pleurodeles waltl]
MEGPPSWCQPHILLDCRVKGGTAVLVPATQTPGLQCQWRDSRPGASHTYSWTAGSMEGPPSWCQPHILLDCRINGGTAVLVPATHAPRLQDQWRGSGPGAIHTYSWTAGSLTDSCPGASHTYSWTAGSMEGQLSWNQPHILLDCRVNGETVVLVPATHTPGLPGQWRDRRPGARHTYSCTAGSMEGQPSWCQPHILLDCRVKGETAVLVPATHTLGLQDHFRDSRHGASHTYSWTAGSMEGQWSRCHPHILLDCGVNGGTADLVPATHTPGLHGQWRDSRPGTSHTYSWTAGSMEGQLSWCQPHILLDRVNGGTAVLVPATHTPGLQGQWRDSQPGASHTFSWTAGSMEGQPSWFHPYILLDCRVTDGQLSWCQTHILLDYRINGGTAVLEPATHTPGLQAQWRDSRPGASHTYSWTAGSMEGQPSWCQPHILLDRVNGGTAVLEPATHTPGLQDQWRDSHPGASHTYSWTGSMEGQPSWCQPHILLDCRINGGTAVLVPATHTPGQGQWRDSRPGASHTYSWTAGSMEGQLSWCQPHILLDCRINGGTAVLVPATHTPGQGQWRDSRPGARHTYSWTAGSMEGQPSWCQPHILLDRFTGGTAVLVPATHTPGLQFHWRDSRPGASHTYSWTAGSMEGQPACCQPHILLHRVNGGTAVLVPPHILLECRINGGTAVLVPATHTPGM